jgi:hypothetical protein
MSDSPDNSTVSDSTSQLEELLTTIRTALAQDAGADSRSAGAIACRAILGTLDPASRSSTPFNRIPMVAPGASSTQPSTSSVPASPIAALLGAIGLVPREQLLDVIGGLRWLLGQPAPAYLTRPTPPRPPGDGS